MEAAAPPAREHPRARRRPWRRRLRRPLAAVAPPLLGLLLRALRATLRFEYVHAEELQARWQRGERAIVAFWHNRLLMLPVVAARVPICIMASHHRDGQVATRLLSGFGVATVRGSASRGAVAGFLRLVAAYRRGHNLAVLPDGPRGPRYVAKPGVIRLAKAVGAPIYPMTYAASRATHLRSWDRLVVPLPFARIRIEVGAPLSVPPQASPAELEALRAELEARLNALTATGEARGAAASSPGASTAASSP